MHFLWTHALQLQCCKSEAVTLFSLYPGAYQKAGGAIFSSPEEFRSVVGSTA